MCGNHKRSNIGISRVPEGMRKCGTENKLKDIVAGNFPKFPKGINLQNHEA